MPPLNGNHVSVQQEHGARRGTVGKIVPAIPFALSKPRPARPQPKPETIAKPLATQTEVKKELPKDEVQEEVSMPVEAVRTPPAEAQTDSFNGVHDKNKEQDQERELVRGSATATPISRDSAPMELSNGTTPELQPAVQNGVHETTAMLPNGQAETSIAAVTASPAPHRKQSETFDMKHIRTELPPAFVPSADNYTPHSASSHTRYPPPGLTQVPAHAAHPSSSSIHFGGIASSSSSPAPPLSAGFRPPPPPFHGHAHHPSNAWVSRPGFAPIHPHAHLPQHPNGPPLKNGHATKSRSSSQTSSARAELQSPVGLGHNGSIRTIFPDRNGALPTPSFPPPEFSSDLDNAIAIRDHVDSQLRNPELADCHLQITDEAGGRQYLEGHKLILARSPTLLSIIRNSDAPVSAALKTQVHVSLKGQFVVLGSFMVAVRYIYGGPLPSFEIFHTANGMSIEDKVDLGLKYIATGAWLHLPAFAHRGVDICASLLHWDTISQTLAFVLDGGLGQMWPINDQLEYDSEPSDDSSLRPEANGSPTYDPYASILLHRTLDYIVANFPRNFYLDQSAQQLSVCSRLPLAPPGHESKSSVSNPRLSKIRFGSMSADDHQRPSHTATNVSSILLSLPFPLLKYLLEHPLLVDRLGPDTVGSVMRQVVTEREVRRQKALKVSSADRTDIERIAADNTGLSTHQNLHWEEAVQDAQNKAGFHLVRTRRGIDTPPSSTTSERLAK